MKRGLVLMVSVMQMVLASGPAVRAEVIERVAAVVNNEIITWSEYQEELQPILAQALESLGAEEFATQRRAIEIQVLDAMIDEVLVLQEATTQGVRVLKEEIDERIEVIKRDNNLETQEDLERALAKEGMSLVRIRRDIERHITMMRMRAREVQFKVEVTDADALTYYESHLEEYAVPPMARISLLTLPLASQVELFKQDKLEQAARLRERIMAGADFQEMVEQYMPADIVASAGDIGWVERDKVLPAIADLAFELDVGAVSEPFETEFGINLLLVTDRRDATHNTFQEVKEEIKRRLMDVKMEARTRDWLDGLRSKSFIDKK
ncbi:peptidyl-prolyl cis-trans isomerase [bacterium]|nr:peptidyl-prolyl cis-trans isomerase [candidate division CSSED10-310 bacterium]